MAHSYLASMEEELICCVCFELFVDPHTPKDLSCPHVICVLCLDQLPVSLDNALECPQCRVVTTVPEDGVAALRTNLGMRNLAEKHRKHLQKHDDEPDKKEQQSVPLPRDIPTDDEFRLCFDHGEKMHFYCKTCNLLVCHACTVVNHVSPEHRIADVTVLRKEHAKQRDAMMGKLRQDALRCETTSRHISDTKQKIMSSINTEEEKIDRAVAFVVESVYEQGDTLKAEIRRKTDPKLKLCQRKQALLQKEMNVLKDAIADTDAIADEETAQLSDDFVTKHHALMDKLDAIQGHSIPTAVHYNTGEVEFKPGQLTIKLGTIRGTQRDEQVREEVVLRERNSTGMRNDKLKARAKLVGFTGMVISIASNTTGDILAISEENSSMNRQDVHIYCKQSRDGQYTKRSSLEIPDAQIEHEHCFVTIASDGKYMIAKGRSIHVYSAAGRYQRVCYTAPPHPDTHAMRLRCITTTKDGRIVAGDYARSVVTVHTPDGMTLLKRLDTIIQPSSVTAINDTHLAISHYGANKVCVIDLESGRETLRIDIDEPWAVRYDETIHCLLISRDDGPHAGVIDQYDLLTSRKVACIAHNLHWSTALCFTGDGILAVGDCNIVRLYSAGLEDQ